MFDKGSGPTIVVVQPLQGRWQWMRPFLEALARQCRVITYTLAGDFGADRGIDPTEGFATYVRQLEDVIDRCGVDRIALCGISFGGTVAVRYAALHPERVTRLIVVSSPGPGWRATNEQARYISRPLLTLPLFLTTALRRLGAELKAALPSPSQRLAFVVRAAVTAGRYPAMPSVMARRVRLMQTIDLADDCVRIAAPTLIVTGNPSLDHVVPVESTRRFESQIRGSRYVMMENTGHSGSLTQPEHFARIVGEFVNASNS
jgi:pimeloyl-ACP methyl ester carboxylesterase